MKKFIALMLAMIMTLSLVACGSDTTDNPVPPSGTTEVETPEVPESTEPDTVEDIFNISNINAEIGKNDDGEDIILITFDWTNGTEDTTSYMVATSVTAFQGGIELETTLPAWGGDSFGETYGNQTLEVRPGTTLTITECFALRDTTTEVEAEWDEWISFDDTILHYELFTF